MSMDASGYRGGRRRLPPHSAGWPRARAEEIDGLVCRTPFLDLNGVQDEWEGSAPIVTFSMIESKDEAGTFVLIRSQLEVDDMTADDGADAQVTGRILPVDR